MSELPELVQALLTPGAYPEPTQQVELVQTQMSFVFLTDDYVYKVKKPVNLGYLDYTTLEKRKYFCQQEIELNRRLCSDAYLGVVPISYEDGKYSVGGQGESIEYAVKMRRLPQEAMMNVLLAGSQVSHEMIDKLAQRLAEFHLKAKTSDYVNTFGSIDTITQNTEENFAQTEKYIGVTVAQVKYQLGRQYRTGAGKYTNHRRRNLSR